MATQVQEVLNATGMSLAIYCGGQSYVGVRLAGTWVGTVTFQASQDGLNFNAVAVTPYASGTAVTTSTTTGNWLLPVANYVAFRVVFTRTSGSVAAYLASSLDQSYQDAFLAPSSRHVAQASSANATNTLTVAASTNRAWKLTDLVVTSDRTPTWASSPALTIKDGTTVLWQGDLAISGSSGQFYTIALPEGGITNTLGNSLVIVAVAGGSGCITNINATVSAA